MQMRFDIAKWCMHSSSWCHGNLYSAN